MNKPGAQLPNIFYISLPENLKTTVSGFTVDPSILLPVEVPPGEEDFRLDSLSWEMIVAGILKVLAYDLAPNHAEYYRRFVLAVKPDISDQLEDAGIIKVRNKEYDLAEDIFKALAGLKPSDVAYSVNLALLSEERSAAYAELGKKDLEDHYLSQAFEYYKKALAAHAENPDVCYNAGSFFLRNGNIEKAEECFRTFLAHSSDERKRERVTALLDDISSRIRLDGLFKEAFDFIQLGKEEEGIEKITAFLKEHSNYANAWFMLGWAHRRLKQYDEGKNAFLKALDLGSPHADTLNELSICLMELKDYTGARTRLLSALKLEPNNTKLLSNLAILSMKEHREGEAAEIFSRILDIDPEDAIALEFMTLLQGRT